MPKNSFSLYLCGLNKALIHVFSAGRGRDAHAPRGIRIGRGRRRQPFFILHLKKHDSRKQVEVNQIFVELSIGNPRSRRYRIGNQLRRGIEITLPVA